MSGAQSGDRVQTPSLAQTPPKYAQPLRDPRTGVLRWPAPHEVIPALRESSQRLVELEPRIAAVGYFGSYARGDWGVGSDLDLIVVVDLPPSECTNQPLLMRKRELQWLEAIDLPVPFDLFVYTPQELRDACERSPRFRQTLREEAVWLVGSLPT